MISARNKYTRISFLSLLLLTNFIIHVKAQQSISAENTSQYLGDGQWKWSVYIKAGADVLNKISYVKYKLHSTFSPQERTVNKIGDSNFPFALTATGWGTFEIQIKIIFTDGRTQNLSYQLHFGTKSQSNLSFSTGQTVTKLKTNWYKWTIYVKGREADLRQVSCIEYTLHETFSNPIQEICERGTGNAFPISFKGWGTFRIKIKIYLKNGVTQELWHDMQ